MADPRQLALLKRSVKEWNEWRRAHDKVQVNLEGADLRGADLREVSLWKADLRGADLREASLWKADLSYADLRQADLSYADLRRAYLRQADLSGAHFRGADLRDAYLWGTRREGINLQEVDLSETCFNYNVNAWVRERRKSTRPKPQPDQSSSTTNWLSLVETVGEHLLVTAASFAAIIQGLDVIERRWREHQAKHQQSTPPTSPSSSKLPISDKDITDILLVMDDGSHHSFQRWVSDPDTLRGYIDAFNDPSSKVKPLQVVFRKREGRALTVNVTEGGKDNRQLNLILNDYLEADPQ